MIDFSTLQGLTIPEGVVTQITDASGRVIWAVQSDNSEPIILEVEKITSDTYAGETTYTGEQFILLDIYPKTNGTVSVTYGGLTKTITDTSGAAEPNAQTVFFGTFNGVSDSVETPASGELTIEGRYAAFGVGSYEETADAKNSTYCGCVTRIVELGSVKTVYSNAFQECKGLTNVVIPEGITEIGEAAFYKSGLIDITLPNTLTSIKTNAFSYCNSLKNLTIPKNVNNMSYEISAVDILANAGLERVIMLPTTPPVIAGFYSDSIVFSTSDLLTEIIVPKGCGEAYKAAPHWSGRADIIVEAS